MTRDRYRWIALSCTSLGAFMSVLNGNTLIIALPEIMKNLHAGMNVIMWIMMVYLLAMTVLVPAIGRLADMFGRKKLFVSGFIIFTLGSALCSLSMNGSQLIFSRLIQAIGGALLMANSLPIVTDAFHRKGLGNALGINTMIINIAVVIGPVLGGLLVHLGWRSIFWMNIPIGIAGSIWAAIQLKELKIIRTEQKFDWAGAVLFSLTITSLLAGLSIGAFTGWLKPLTFGVLLLSILFCWLLVRTELRSSSPMIDPALFKSRELTFALIANLLSAVARGAVALLLVFYFQGIKSLDPVLAGMMLAPFAGAMMIVSPFSGWLADRFGVRLLSSLGLLISAAGLIGMMNIRADSSFITLAVWMIIMGLGSGLFFSPNTKAVMGAVPFERRGIAGGIRGMTVNAGNVLSFALAIAMISTSITPQAMEGLFTGTQIGSKGIAISGFIGGLRVVFTVSFCVTLLAAFMSYLRGDGGQKHRRLHTEEKGSQPIE